jgi:3-oxoadipate enol-lactonase
MSIPQITSITLGSGKPLILLHPFPLSHHFWDDLMVPSGYQFILPDFPGFGVSPLAPKGLNLAEAAQGLENHLIQKGIQEPIILSGISMGGYWAMEFIRQFQSRVTKVLFVSTRPGQDKPEAKQNRLKMADRVEKEGVDFLAPIMIPGLVGKTTLATKPKIVNRLSDWIKTTNPAAIALAQRAMAERQDQTNLMPRLKTKVWVLAGLEDTLIPSTEADSMAKVIPGSQLLVLDSVGHLIPLEDPNRFQKILEKFLSDSNQKDNFEGKARD